MKKCNQFRISAVVFAVLLSLAMAVKGTYATPLQDLFNGQSITAGDKVFSEWSLLEVDGNPDLTQIDVQPLPTPALNPGLLFLGNGQLVATPNDPFLFLGFQFTVTSLGPAIKDNSLELVDYEVADSSFAGIFEEVYDPAGNLLVEKLVFHVNSFDFQGFNLFDRQDFDPLQMITVQKFIFVETEGLPDGFAEIIAFEQRFSQVPEPGTMLLLGTGLVGFAGAARRKKKSQA